MLVDASVPLRFVPVASGAAVSVGDPSATRTVYTTVVVLVVLGIVLMALAVWVLRRTRPEPELLAPLETMESRSWRKLDPAAQRRMLDEARPDGAAPLRREASVPAVDDSFATVAPVASFDDLSDDEVVVVAADDDGAAGDGADGDDGAGYDGSSSPEDDETVESARLAVAADVDGDVTEENATVERPTAATGTDHTPVAAERDAHLIVAAGDVDPDDGDARDGDTGDGDTGDVAVRDADGGPYEDDTGEIDQDEVIVVRSIDPLLGPKRPSSDPSN